MALQNPELLSKTLKFSDMVRRWYLIYVHNGESDSLRLYYGY